MRLFKKLSKKRTASSGAPSCRYCKAIASTGRSGEREIEFVDGDTAIVEIINESHVEGRTCYTLNILNDPEVGWNDIPIKYCPFCGKKLGGEC